MILIVKSIHEIAVYVVNDWYFFSCAEVAQRGQAMCGVNMNFKVNSGN